MQFGCRIPIRREFTDAEKMALKNGLVDLDSEVFQLFDEPLQKSSSCLFQVLRQLIIGPNTTTFPSFYSFKR